MAILEDHKVTEALYDAGFRKQSLLVALAIAWASSQLKDDLRVLKEDGSFDRGLFQLNSSKYPMIPDQVAYSLKLSCKEVFKLTREGQDFTAFKVYTDGTYRQYLDRARQGIKKFARNI